MYIILLNCVPTAQIKSVLYNYIQKRSSLRGKFPKWTAEANAWKLFEATLKLESARNTFFVLRFMRYYVHRHCVECEIPFRCVPTTPGILWRNGRRRVLDAGWIFFVATINHITTVRDTSSVTVNTGRTVAELSSSNESGTSTGTRQHARTGDLYENGQISFVAGVTALCLHREMIRPRVPTRESDGNAARST